MISRSARRRLAIAFAALGPITAFAQTFDFTGVFDPSAWTFSSGGAPADVLWDGNSSFTLTGSNGGAGASPFASSTTLLVSLSAAYRVSFDWSYSTGDGAQYDPAGYTSSGSNTQLTDNAGNAFAQSGTATNIYFGTGQSGLYIFSTDNQFGAATFTISNFSYTLADPGDTGGGGGGGDEEPPPPPAGTVAWTGAIDNDWSNSANWTPSAPDSTTVVEIAGGKTPLLSGPAATSQVFSFSVTEGALLTVADGAQLSGAGAFVNDDGTLALTGSGTSLTTTSFATIGHGSHGTFTISDGATATVGALWTSVFGSATSTITIDGAGSRLTSTGAEGADIIGYGGASQLTVRNGARYDAVEITIGYFNPGTPATLTVTGAGSRLNTTGMLKIAEFGEGNLIISDGAVANTGNGEIAFGSVNGAGDVIGTATVTGAGSTWNITGSLGIGSYINASMFTQGTLTIADGGLVSVNNGAGTAIMNQGSVLNIGDGGLAGTLAVASVETGGSLVFNHTDDLVFAATIKDYLNAATSGTLQKSGSGTPSLTGANTYAGGTRVNSGTLSVSSNANLGDASGGVTLAGGNLRLSNNTATAFDRAVTVTADSGVVSNRSTNGAGVTHTLGTLAIGAHTLSVTRGPNATSGTGGITFGATTLTGDATFQVGANARLNLGAVSGNHGFTKTGAGNLTLTGANTFTGPLTISAGILALASTASLSSATDVRVGTGATFDVSAVSGGYTVASGRTLGGAGSFNGLVTIGSGARLSPGNSPGTLTFANGLALADGAILDFELGTASDLIRVTGGTLSAAGTIIVNIADSGGFEAGIYTLFNATGATLTSIGATSFEIGDAVEGFTYEFSQADNFFLLTATAVPEPATAAVLLGLTALGLAATRRRRLKTAPSR